MIKFPEFFSKKNNRYFIKKGEEFICDDHVVPVMNDIPRFVKHGSYASLFGDQWKQYQKTQLDSYTGTTISRKRIERCLGDELSKGLAGKLVLEPGCGAGRFTEILLEKKATLISSDISSAVEVNKINFPITDQHLIIQADINEMPFKDATFDVVICMGVIQHTPDSEVAIQHLYELVKAGGYLIIDHYTFNRSSLFRLATIYRWFLRKQSADKTIPFTQRMVKRYLPWHKKFTHNKIASVLLNRISPVISYYRALPQLNDEHQEQWALLDTHDSLTDWYKRYRTRGSILRTLQKLGASDIWCKYGGNGVEARCRKPVDAA